MTLFLTRAGIFVILFSFNTVAFAQSANKIANNKCIFDQLKQVPEKDRLDKAYVLYRLNFRHVKLPVVMANLDSLSVIATDLNDEALQCAVFDMHADYFSVNNGFNQVSTDYYQKAIDYAADNDLPVQKGIAENNKGGYYFIYKHYIEACECFLESQETFRDIGYDKVPKISVYLMHIVDFYYALGDYDNAMINLQDALKYTKDNERNKINIINTIGLVYRNYRQFPQAINYFNQAMQLAASTRDTIWIGITKGNIGSVYFLQGEYEKAVPYINIDYKTSLRYNEPANGALAMLRLAKINIDTKNLKIAGLELDTVKRLLSGSQEDVLNSWADFNNLESQFYEQLNKPAASLNYRKLYEGDKDSLIKRNNIAAVERVKLRYETDKHNAELSKAKEDDKVLSTRIDAVIAVLFLLVVISLLLYNRQRNARKKDKELAAAEKRVTEQQLTSARNALRGFTENLRQKNMLIEKFKTEIDHLNNQSAGKANAGHLEKLLNAHIMTDENWNDFKKLFSQVHPGFFVNLTKNYPQLSATDTRLLALIKLGLNNAEMANMLGITIEGIKKAKQRLRKKIDNQTINGIAGISDF